MKYMAQPGAPAAARQGPLFKDNQAKRNSATRLEHRNSDTPVGAGKSTFSMSLATRLGGTHIALDEWFARLFSPDRPGTDVVPWYTERKSRLLDHIWNHARELATCGTTPILELGLVQRRSREEFYQRAHEAGVDLTVYLLVASRGIRRARVMRRNVEMGPTFSMVVPAPFFEMASDMWEEPDESEISENGIETISAEAEAP